MASFRTYYQLAKPGIIYGNAVSAVAGFFLASQGSFHGVIFLAMLLGVSLVIGSGCVFNNYLDREIDRRMARTKKRAFVAGDITPDTALTYGAFLGLTGIIVLALFCNVLTATIGVFSWFMYVVVYGHAKRRTVHGTLVGSIAGAMPIVGGYTAVTGQLDRGALLLFLILALWQMPHFFGITLYRIKDYEAAGLPVLPLVRGVAATKTTMLWYVAAFTVAATLLTFTGYTGYTYLTVALLLGLSWLWTGLKTLKTSGDAVWGRRMFRVSLIVLVVLCTVISLDSLLP